MDGVTTESAVHGRRTDHSVWCIEVALRDDAGVQIEGIAGLVQLSRLFYLRGAIDENAAADIARRLLCDAVVEVFDVGHVGGARRSGPAFVDVLPKPGVMDPVALSTETAIAELGYPAIAVRTGRRYRAADGTPCVARLGNSLIESFHHSADYDPFITAGAQPFVVHTVDLRKADDAELARLSRDGHLFLDLAEMQTIRAHYIDLERDPTDIELETLAQTWSEHCVHKTLKSAIHYSGSGFPERVTRADQPTPETIERSYGNLLVETIAAATKTLNKPWCLSVFEDNAGIIAFDDVDGVAFKVETHNHPSALEPYGGAATGIGGCIRDILGCGLGARPVANTDVFCVAGPVLEDERVPAGLFHPRRTLREVVRGVRDYGNRMGIPTVGGAVVFDERYLGNPLVYCGCVGMIPRDRITKSCQPGDRIVVVGGRTGRDGIHGATFSSGAMTDTHADEFAHAVQIGNAITEKQVLDVLLAARDDPDGPLYRAVTDCGAGGLSSAVGEMAEGLGAEVELDHVPLKYDGLRYDEVWISEAQERMVLAVPPDRLETLLALCRSENVEATDIGVFADSGRLVLRWTGQTVGDLDLAFVHDGLPRRVRTATWSGPGRAGRPAAVVDVQATLCERLAAPNIASKEWIIRQYDHEVQGGSVIKPLMGPGAGPSDGAVVRPKLDSAAGIALSCGLCPEWSDVDPYIMAIAAVDEAVRNNICIGGDLQHMAILDNFCWGGVKSPEKLGEVVRAAQGCHDAALAYGIPFISGKDSLNNLFHMSAADSERTGWPPTLEIPGTLLISALSVMPDVQRARSSDLKTPGNRVLMIGPIDDRLAALAAGAQRVCQLMATCPGIVSAHDVSEGGPLVAAAEMVIGSRYGLALEWSATLDALFEEPAGHYLIEVQPDQVAVIEDAADLVVTSLGRVIPEAHLTLSHGAQASISWTAGTLRSAWRGTFAGW